jgi:hypothetical protein
MYSQSDPRSKLASAPYGAAEQGSAFAGAEYIKFHDEAPHEFRNGTRTWYARGQNFVLGYTEATLGTTLERKAHPDEYMVLIPAETKAVTIVAQGKSHEVPGNSVVIVPPGDSKVTTSAGMLVRLFTSASDDLNRSCLNASAYREPHPRVAPLQPWPAPPSGYRVRVYSLDVPPQEGRFGRIWRTQSLMMNVVPPEGPRDVTKLSPHHHDDFEQCSLALEGSFLHHLRWPWTANSKHWRSDEHELCPAPSMAVIPPPAIHTSAATAARNQLVDIFAPPRMDFSKMQGWVLNADEYPMP